MIWLFVALAVAATVLIAVYAVNRVTARLAATAGRSVYDLDEATEWVADRLPDQLAAKLSHDDVRAILYWHLEYLRGQGIATYGRVDGVAEEAREDMEGDDMGPVLEEDEAVDAVLARAQESSRDIEALDVVVVLDTEAGYLRAIGAVGDEVDD